MPRPECGHAVGGMSEGGREQRVPVLYLWCQGSGQPDGTVTCSRNLCLRKWSFSSSRYWCLPMPTWKQFFLSQMRHERRMASAEPEDFVYKEGTGNLGVGTGNVISLC